MRNAREMREMMELFRRGLKASPEAGALTAVVDISDDIDRCDVSAWTVDMSATHLVALAETLLERAGQRIAAMPHLDDDLRQCLRGIEAARVALDFTELDHQA